jgi:hypothetical protein
MAQDEPKLRVMFKSDYDNEDYSFWVTPEDLVKLGTDLELPDYYIYIWDRQLTWDQYMALEGEIHDEEVKHAEKIKEIKEKKK